jgi:CHAP domain
MWKSKKLKWAAALLGLGLIAFLGMRYSTRINWNTSRSIGQALDSLDGVAVYYNGGVNQTHGRNTSPQGYNVGLRYQCVEFVKRYYLEVYHHQLPDAYGHARDFYDPAVPDGGLNAKRGLLQFKNGGAAIPQRGDLLIWGPSFWNAYGHVAIVSELRSAAHAVEYIQQNPGPWGNARAVVNYEQTAGKCRLMDERILGWLRMR